MKKIIVLVLTLVFSISVEATSLIDSNTVSVVDKPVTVNCKALEKKIKELKSLYRKKCRNGNKSPFYCDNLDAKISYLERKHLAACY